MSYEAVPISCLTFIGKKLLEDFGKGYELGSYGTFIFTLSSSKHIIIEEPP